MVTVPVHVSHSCYVQNSPSHPCRMNAEYVIEICSAGEWFPSAGQGRKSSLTHHVSDVWVTQNCVFVSAHQSQMEYLPLRQQRNSCDLLFLSASCGYALCGSQGLAGAFTFWNLCATWCGWFAIGFQKLALLPHLVLGALSRKLSAPL